MKSLFWLICFWLGFGAIFFFPTFPAARFFTYFYSTYILTFLHIFLFLKALSLPFFNSCVFFFCTRLTLTLGVPADCALHIAIALRKSNSSFSIGRIKFAILINLVKFLMTVLL